MKRRLGLGTMSGRLAVAVLLAGALVGIPGAIALRSSANDTLRQEVEGRNAEFTAALADQLDARVLAVRETLELVASRADIVALRPGSSELAVAIRVLDNIDELALFNAAGRPMAAAGARSLIDPADLAPRADLVAEVIETGFSVRTTGEDPPLLEVAVPVENPPGTRVGVLLARSPVDLIAQSIQARPLGSTAKAFLVDTGGRIVAHPERNRVLDRERYPLDRLLDAGTGLGVVVGGGDGTLAAAAETQVFPGAVVVEQEESEAIEPVSGRVSDLTALLVAVVGVMVVVVVIVVSRLLAPLRGLARAVNRLARGDHSARAPVGGSSELRAVAEEINRMADALEARLLDLGAARRELEEAEARFRTAFELAPVGMALADLDGRYLQVNPAFCELVQRRADSLLGTGWQSLTHPDDLGVSETSLEEALRAGLQRYQVENRYLRPDGSAVWVLLSVAVVRRSDGQPDHFIAHVQDVTPQRRAQEELARLFGQAADAEERLRRVIDSAPDATLVVSADGRIEFASRKTVDVFGWEPDDLVGQAVEVLMPESFRHGHVAERSAYVDAPRTRQMGAGLELSGLRRDGTEFPVEVALSPLQTDEGWKVVAAVRDVTERRVAQAAAQALLEARARQRQAMEVNDTIVQGLTVARWSLEMGEQHRALEALERTLGSARGLIGDMLMEASPDGLRPGDLVRERPADLS